MPRKTQLRPPGFTLTPVAPLDVVRKGMETAKADLANRLTRQRSEAVKLASLRQKPAHAQLEALRRAGVDLTTLTDEARQLRQQVRGAPKEPLAVLSGLQPEIPVGVAAVPGYSLVTPPYSYDWSATGYIDYAPGTLSAYANREAGTLSFQDVSADPCIQVNVSYAAAAVGISFSSQVLGVLSVATIANISEIYGYLADSTGANTRGWVGLLVQAYDASNSLVATPIYQQIILFDEGSSGHFLEHSDDSQDNPSLNEAVLTPGFFVSPDRWYAIWLWCGGDIHAEGFPDAPLAYGSDAWATMNVSVPFLLLNFQSARPR